MLHTCRWDTEEKSDSVYGKVPQAAGSQSGPNERKIIYNKKRLWGKLLIEIIYIKV